MAAARIVSDHWEYHLAVVCCLPCTCLRTVLTAVAVADVDVVGDGAVVVVVARMLHVRRLQGCDVLAVVGGDSFVGCCRLSRGLGGPLQLIFSSNHLYKRLVFLT